MAAVLVGHLSKISPAGAVTIVPCSAIMANPRGRIERTIVSCAPRVSSLGHWPVHWFGRLTDTRRIGVAKPTSRSVSGLHFSDLANGLINRMAAAIRGRLKTGTITVPLSAVHYIQIARIIDRKRRARLGETMWALSGGRTLASFRKLIEPEIEEALARRYPEITPETFELLGKGFAYALRIDYAYQIPDELRSRLAGGSN